MRWSRHGTAAKVLLGALLLTGPAGANIDLPLLSRVEKILSFPDNVDPQQLLRFSKLRDLTIEIRIKTGDMLPPALHSLLMDRFAGIPKRIVLSKLPTERAIERLRKLEPLEVVVFLSGKSAEMNELDRLYALGPVRKRVVLPGDCGPEALRRATELNFSELGIIAGPGGTLDRETLPLLVSEKARKKVIYLPADATTEALLDLTAIAPLAIEVRTVRNRIPEALLGVLKDMRLVDIVLLVDGRITQEDTRHWASLGRLSLHVHIEDANEITPGLSGLLDSISPP
jgi:hypothetical protein